jgi:ribosomal protein S18 acetylase RimI-like enzyme
MGRTVPIKDVLIRYTSSLGRLTEQKLFGFFEGWQRPLSPDQHVRILKRSTHLVLAIDQKAGRVVGFINALTDGCNSAFIPLLEVLPEYQNRGVGSELVRRMLALLADYPCIDLTCDPGMQAFYERHGMVRSVGMSVRDYNRSGPR